MTYELNEIILALGKNAAMEKMSPEKCLSKPDMRTYSFSDLWLFLGKEVRELQDELLKLDYSKGPFQPVELLNAIRDEAGGVIAFASGIAAKAIQEIQKQNDEQPALWDELDQAVNLAGQNGRTSTPASEA
jgi:hypothetical protein